MKAIAYVLVGIVLGGGFVYDKLTTPPHASEDKTEIVYGTRVGPADQLMLVTSK